MSGEKRGLLIGINYYGTSSELAGCINDTKSIKEILLKSGYLEQNIVLMNDDYPNTDVKYPTKQNILNAIAELVRALPSGSKLFFHYSGHGTQVTDNGTDEVDKKDEAICPVDYSLSGFITDDELYNALVKPLDETITLHTVMDSCHSGTVLDLRYNYKFNKNIEDDRNLKNITRRNTRIYNNIIRRNNIKNNIFIRRNNKKYDKDGYDKYRYDKDGYNNQGYNKAGYNKDGYNKQGFDRQGYNKDGYNKQGYNRQGFNKDGYNKQGYNKDGFNKDGYNKQGYDKDGYNKNGIDKYGNKRPINTPNNDIMLSLNINNNNVESKATVCMFSGCRDNQTSADTYEGGKNVGAMTNAFYNVYKDGITYETLLNNILQYLKGKYTQLPQLSFGKPVDVKSVVRL